MTLKDVQARLGLKTDGRWGRVTATALLDALTSDAGLLAVPLSEHFTLGELVASETARARGLVNHPTPAQLLAMVAICDHVLERVRSHYDRPVRVTSGFRIFTPTSQHGRGEAVDFEVPGIANIDVARWIRDTLRFDQLILEAWTAGGDPNAGWIHCSYRADRARRSVLWTPTGKAPYQVGLPS